MSAHKPMTLEEIQRTLEALEAERKVKRTGEFRNGRPIYVVTEAGRAEADERFADDPLEGLGDNPIL
jgi:DNA-binding PadR family transcriptional regulator